ncbi:MULTISPECIES: restriction endonuclease subunit S [Aeromonas]|uniref:restriction endonuclease subunit S n=1 Tax=Aeromonas TaxID=642 RepID=UPI0022E39C24|nr:MULTISPECIES: restriction endonuclease subunit S [Aeromonas]WEA28272.1 restriction endonuclease subunit S [Aeromonas hydrophila]
MSEAVTTRQQELAGKYRPYPKYKDSGVVWLGEMPSTWVLAKTARYFKIAMGQTILKEQLEDNGEWPVYSATEGDHYFGRVNNPQVRLGCGDLVIPARGNSIGFVKLVKEQVTTTQTTIYCKHLTQKIYPEYAYHFMVGQKENLFWFTQTAIPQITVEEIGSNPILLPSFEEQRTIAAFLDYETAQIDRLIAQQQRLIELLKEKRQAVISHAVTKGLNPNAPMKDSGVEWLGQVPEHWQCVPFGLLVSRADLGGNYLGGQEENGIPFLKMGNLGRGRIVLDKLECLEEGSSFDDAHRLSMGDFLFNTRNSLDLVGKVAVWHDELEYVLYNSNLLRVRFKKDFISSPDFMGFVFNSSGALGWLALLAKGTTSVAAIYYKDLRSMVVPIPPVDEQNAISSFISKCLSRLDTLEEKAIQSINLMNERRTALISAAVTGKIDLRGWTPPADEVAA